MARKAKVLVIEDETFVQQLIGHLLEAAGYGVALCSTAEQGLTLFKSDSFELVILDLNLPDEDGLTVARQLRAKSDVPIIVLSARETREDRVSALEIGVDDFVPKPVEPQELVLRINNLLARTASRQDGVSGNLLQFDGWTLDQKARTLENPDGEDVHLTKAEFDLLSAFLRAPNRVLERSFLLDAVGRLDQPETDRTIDVLIGRLRNKIEENSKVPVHILTVFGVGYRFATKVERA